MSKTNFTEQAEKLKSLVGTARLTTTPSVAVTNAPSDVNQGDAAESEIPAAAKAHHEVGQRIEPAKTKAKNLKAIPISYFDAHADLKATSRTSLDFSSYIIEAIREKLERDGALG
ncbi:molecular chaperone GroEL [Cedecea sp. P7760]|uniref:molecular chaperone GroEL n=1 Tax=Cedecea sp. P7760 TaxID=2726983 RepID=UPI0015A0D422|nr:molecular chaperone GroEL [Cedecea sp. P7760]NWC63975.1 molecular chaperone GroEL [Cedecea sp. P7760]